MTRASSQVKVGGTFYYGFQMVIAAIDALAALLIRRLDYFLDKGTSPASEDGRERERIEREAEAGLRPWPDG